MTLIQAQEKLIARVNAAHPGHRRRVIRGAAAELRRYLARNGVVGELAHSVTRDAIDMANLELACEE